MTDGTRYRPLQVIIMVAAVLAASLVSCGPERSDWRQAQRTGTTASYEEFLRNNPHGRLVKRATEALHISILDQLIGSWHLFYDLRLDTTDSGSSRVSIRKLGDRAVSLNFHYQQLVSTKPVFGGLVEERKIQHLENQFILTYSRQREEFLLTAKTYASQANLNIVPLTYSKTSQGLHKIGTTMARGKNTRALIEISFAEGQYHDWEIREVDLSGKREASDLWRYSLHFDKNESHSAFEADPSILLSAFAETDEAAVKDVWDLDVLYSQDNPDAFLSRWSHIDRHGEHVNNLYSTLPPGASFRIATSSGEKDCLTQTSPTLELRGRQHVFARPTAGIITKDYQLFWQGRWFGAPGIQAFCDDDGTLGRLLSFESTTRGGLD